MPQHNVTDIRGLKVCDDYDEDCSLVADPESCMKGGLYTEPCRGLCLELQNRQQTTESELTQQP